MNKMTLNQKREQMRSIVEQWKDSDQSQRIFAEQQNIALEKLRYWIKQFSEGNSEGNFIQLKSTTSPEIIIRYPNGVELIVGNQTSLSSLRSLIFI